MKERPILFSGEMVRAILDDRKTQTRRVIKPQPLELCDEIWQWKYTEQKEEDLYEWLETAAPYQVGDRLWVREAIRIDSDCSAILYAADKARVFRGKYQIQYAYYPQDWPWKRTVLPSIFMPKWAARIWLEITGVRAERVQDISAYDILKEGVKEWMLHLPRARSAFQALWDSLSAQRGYPFADNPWVWVYEFKRLETSVGAKQ